MQIKKSLRVKFYEIQQIKKNDNYETTHINFNIVFHYKR